VIAGLCVPSPADGCAVDLFGDDGLERAAAAGIDVAPGVLAADHDVLVGPGRIVVSVDVEGRRAGTLSLVKARGGFGPAALPLARRVAVLCAVALERDDLRRTRDEFEAILDGVADAITVQDTGGRLAYVNDAAVQMLGFPDRATMLASEPRELVGEFTPFDAQGRPVALDQLPGERALAGETPDPVIIRFTDPASGASRWARLKARPLRSRGRAFAINVIEDVSDLQQALETQRLLAEAGRVLARSLDFEDTLARVAGLAVPELGDWCVVDLVGDRGLERVAVAHADPAHAEVAAAMRGRIISPDSAAGPAAVARTGRSELHAEIDAERVEAADDLDSELAALVRRVDMRSAVSVPMSVRGQRLGVITLATTAHSGRRLGPAELAVAEDLGRRAAVAVESARLHSQRSAIARTLQASLLPPHLPEIPGLETGALYRAAGEGSDVGGDFYDLFTVADDEWIAVIGDVCGKGAEAAAVTALARYTIRAAGARRRSPAAILGWLNEAMRRQDIAGRFCTITCVHLDLSRPVIRATVACGGHPPALVVRGPGKVEAVGAGGTLLGLLPDPKLIDVRAELRAGDSLVLYTDGITEARAPDRLLDETDLGRVLGAAARQPVQRMVEQLAAYAVGKDGVPPRDDLAVLALRARG